MPTAFPQPPLPTSEPPPDRRTTRPLTPAGSRTVGLTIAAIIAVLFAASFILNRVRGSTVRNDSLDLGRIEAAFHATGVKKTELFYEIIVDKEMASINAPPDNDEAWRILREDIERYAAGSETDRQTAQTFLQRIETHYSICLINAPTSEWINRCAERLGWAISLRGDPVLGGQFQSSRWRTVSLLGVDSLPNADRYRLVLATGATPERAFRFDITYQKPVPGQRPAVATAQSVSIDPR